MLERAEEKHSERYLVMILKIGFQNFMITTAEKYYEIKFLQKFLQDDKDSKVDFSGNQIMQ